MLLTIEKDDLLDGQIIELLKDHLKDMYVIPENIFATELEHEEVQLSSEHTAYKFMTFKECLKHLKYDSNKTALYEVNEKIKRKVL